MDYDLTRLGTREFEHLSQALTSEVLGSSVAVFGDGRDGGREAAFRGAVRYPDPAPETGQWDGYGVLQAKFRQRPGANNAGWLCTQLTGEFNRWKKAINDGRERPDYLLFTTNVVLSAVADSGGIDHVHNHLAGLADDLGLKGWDLWHYDQICRFLDRFTTVRRTYAALTTPGDVLAHLMELLQGTAASLGDTMATYTAKQMLASQRVKLSQAGLDDERQLPLSSIGIDLPATVGGNHDQQVPGVVADIIHRGNTILRPSHLQHHSPHMVILGGPGQGKTTLGQLTTQVYRTALLNDRPRHSLGPQVADLHDQLITDLDRLQLPPVISRRWPIQISLSSFGDAIAGGEQVSLLRFLADQVNRRIATPIDAGQMRAWLQEWPWLLILDGLDEVAAPSVRRDIQDRIQDFLVDAAEVDADLLLIVTTRPQGYSQEFQPRYYTHTRLQTLSTEQAIDYAQRLVTLKHGEDIDTIDKVTQRIRTAAADQSTARLMRTPLQVTIMSQLLERRARAPHDPYMLFSLYYDTIYTREIEKAGRVAALLDAHRADIDAIHEQVGLFLQERSGERGETDSVLPHAELLQIAEQRLTGEGHAPEEATALSQQLVTASTERLVLLVPVLDGVGFEVRSLQEFTAARAITTGDDTTVLERLATLAVSPYWRHTWLLAAGRVFNEREHLRSDLMVLIEQLDIGGPLQRTLLPGAGLAVDVLDQDIAARTPRFQRIAVARALRVLELGPLRDVHQLSRVLRPIANHDPQVKDLVFATTDAARESTGVRAVAALVLLADWAGHGTHAGDARRRLRAGFNALTPDQRLAAAHIGFRSHLKLAREFGHLTKEHAEELAAEPIDFPRKLVQHARNRAADEELNEESRITAKIINEGIVSEIEEYKQRGRRRGLNLEPRISALLGLPPAYFDADDRQRRAILEEMAEICSSLPPQDWGFAEELRQRLHGIIRTDVSVWPTSAFRR